MNKLKIASADRYEKYYTNRSIALDLKRRARMLLGVDNPLYTLEPSAGSGSFLEDGDYIVALDLIPENWFVLSPDQIGFNTDGKGSLDPTLLEIIHKEVGSGENILSIGNPPFGKNGKLALQFITEFLKVGGVVAFVLPNSFRRYSLQSILPQNARLIADWDMPEDSFHRPDGTPYDSTRCVFQIWSTRASELRHPDLRRTEAPPRKHNDFEMRRWNRQGDMVKAFAWNYDFAVRCQGYVDYKQFLYQGELPTDKSHYMMFKAGSNVVLGRLKALDFDMLSKRQANTRGFNMWDVVDVY